jgi:quercetin dioxygenase-like cupin family protein
MSEKEWLEKLRSEGVSDVNIVTMEPGEKPEHTHDQITIHVILEGDLTVINKDGTKVYKPQDYIEFPAGTTHSVRFGEKGLTMIVGIKK